MNAVEKQDWDFGKTCSSPFSTIVLHALTLKVHDSSIELYRKIVAATGDPDTDQIGGQQYPIIRRPLSTFAHSLCPYPEMDSGALIDTSTSAQDAANRRKSARSIRKPELFAEEHHEGSLLSNGSTKRKRTTNGTVDEELDEDQDQGSSPEESEGEADEEELREKRRILRSKATGKPAPKKARKSNGVDATLAIRSANVQSKAPSKMAKVQQARARKSQANEEGLYGTSASLIQA